VSLLTLDPLNLVGIKKPLGKLLGWPDEMKLVDSGPYGLVRHPVYTALMLAFWITPTMVGISSSLCKGLTRFLQLEVLAR